MVGETVETIETAEMLEQIGFTKNEAKTYLALLELGEAQTGVLCSRLKIANSHIYRILKSLMDKGVIGYKLKNNIKVFKPNSPETLNVLYLKKQEELENHRAKVQTSIQNLKKLPVKKEAVSDYKYYEGLSGVKSMWLEINEIMIPNTESFVYTANVDIIEKMNVFYLEHHKVRVKKKIFERMILPEGSDKFAKQRESLGYFEAKFLHLDNQAEFGVFEGFMYILYTTAKSQRSFLIKDPVFAESFKSIFNHLWEKAKGANNQENIVKKPNNKTKQFK